MNNNRGFFEIGIYHPKSSLNIGTLWRTAYQPGASAIFTICNQYESQASDTLKTPRHIPYRHYERFESFYKLLPHNSRLVGIETGGKPLSGVKHPERAVYLLGAEDHGLPLSVLECCYKLISIETVRTESFNVAIAGAIVMYDRLRKFL